MALKEETPSRKLDQFAAELVAQRPDLFIRNEGGIGHALPELRGVDHAFPGIRSLADPKAVAFVVMVCAFLGRNLVRQFLTPETAHGSFHPAHEMNAVGDMTDGDFIDLLPRIKALPHLAAHLAMKFADSV